MSDTTPLKQDDYRVLARKYRPQNFEELIGQDALVRTLKNAIETGRIAHAFMLTGVRGVGKTTTARIIAKALNYKGADGTSGPTTGSTDDCQLCQAISEDRHPDVIEMDAATRTGVDDIREILDGVRYAPTEARYKIYIIDEVHMLSKQAFNALLKTLEEPPPHVKFIFATTEIRRVPITVLSRCQRFDLRRVDVPTLSAHFQSICAQENVKADDDAIALIARAADGSVRDGLSLLDQAMALGSETISSQQVQDMLGLGDRARGLDLLERALTGDMPEALEIMSELYRSGADPVVVIQDLLDLTHLLTKLRAVPEAKDMKEALAADTVARASELANKLSMPTLGKAWQLLLKGLSEVQSAPTPQSAAEMVIIRLTYAADLPDPADLIRKLQVQSDAAPAATAQASAPSSAGAAQGASNAQTHAVSPAPQATLSAQSSAPVSQYTQQASAGGDARGASLAVVKTMPEPEVIEEPELITEIKSLHDVVMVLEQANEVLLASQVYQYAHLVKLEEGRLELRVEEQASPKFVQDLGAQLSRIRGNRWIVSVSGAAGAPTMAQTVQAEKDAEFHAVLQMPIMKEILTVFPTAQLTDITTKEK